MLILVFIAIAVIVLLYSRLRKQRRKAGIKGWVVDQDLDNRGNRVYRDSKLGVSCKPDVVERDRLIEYKSATVQGQARSGDILYVAAQMLATGKKEVELRYANIRFTLLSGSSQMQKAMNKVRSIMGQMRKHLTMKIAPKGTPTKNKCGKCQFRDICS